MRPTWGLYYWPYWMTLTALTFGVPELIALFTNTLNTLSDYSWYELGINARVSPSHPAWFLSFTAWILFVVVITGHIWFRTPG